MPWHRGWKRSEHWGSLDSAPRTSTVYKRPSRGGGGGRKKSRWGSSHTNIWILESKSGPSYCPQLSCRLRLSQEHLWWAALNDRRLQQPSDSIVRSLKNKWQSLVSLSIRAINPVNFWNQKAHSSAHKSPKLDPTRVFKSSSEHNFTLSKTHF
jgi:hypothetical protein